MLTEARRPSLLLILLGAIAAVLAAAAAPQGSGGLSQFPLQAGNEWVYVRNGVGEPETWRAAVVEELAPDGEHRDFMLEGYFPGVRAVRCDPAEMVVCDLDHDRANEGLWYHFDAKAGEEWQVRFVTDPPPCLDGAVATLASELETITVPAGTFDKVLRVDYVAPCLDAGLVAEWFAPDVGLIRRVEESFAGPVVSELVRAKVGMLSLPVHARATSLAIDSPVYHPLEDGMAPTMKLTFELRNAGTEPVGFTFAGCKSATIRIADEWGRTVLLDRADDGGCCQCKNLIDVSLAGDILALPAEVTLTARKNGVALPDGRYAVIVTLNTLDPAMLRPTVGSAFEVRSKP